MLIDKESLLVFQKETDYDLTDEIISFLRLKSPCQSHYLFSEFERFTDTNEKRASFVQLLKNLEIDYGLIRKEGDQYVITPAGLQLARKGVSATNRSNIFWKKYSQRIKWIVSLIAALASTIIAIYKCTE